MRDWIGATPLRLSLVPALLGGTLFFLGITFLNGGGVVGASVSSVLWTAVMFAAYRHGASKAFPGPTSTWASLDRSGKRQVARSVRTREVPEDPRLASAVLERVQAFRGQGRPGARLTARLDVVEARAAAVLEAPPA